VLSELSVKKPYLVIVFIIIIAILGGVAYFNMTIDLLPNMNLPYIAIVVVAPGSSPEDVERTITSPVEQEMATIDNVKRINSSANEHYGMVIMEFSGSVDLNSAMLDIQTSLVAIKSGFPEMSMDPMILKLDPSMLAVMNIAISEEGKTINESSKYLESVGQDLLSVEGVASISYEGLVDNLVLVMLDSNKLQNSITDMIIPDRDNFVDEDAYREAVLNTPEGQPVPMRDDYVDEAAYQEAYDSAQSVAEMAGGMITSMLQPELVGMALYAQNFNMPAGNVTIDGVSYLVKIGDKIHSYDDLNDMSILSVDLKKIVDNYEQIVNLLRGITVNQATLDAMKALGDEDGIVKTTIDSLNEYLENFEDSPFFEQQTDPITGEVSYIIDSSIVDGLAALSDIAEDLDDFVLTAESLGTIEIVDLLIEYFSELPDTEDIVAELTNIKATLVSIRQMIIGGSILVEQPRVDVNGNPVLDPVTGAQYIDYVVNPVIIEMFITFGEISDSLAEVEITEQQLLDLREALTGLRASLDDIAAFATTAEEALRTNPDYFKIIYYTDSEGNYLDSEGNITEDPDEYVVLRYVINTDLIDAVESIPPITFKVNQIANAVMLDTAGNQHSIVNGVPGVMISIQKQSGISTVTVSKGVDEKLKEISEENPDFKYITLMDQGEFVVFMINTIIQNLLFGALFAILILFVFLKRFKPTLIVGSSIFISVVAAFVLMYFAGITLNIISMGGLALGVGMLVDNSIVVIENIYRRREEGDSVFDACVKGAKQVSGAIIASTLTTIIIFLPIAFIEGITKQIFTDIAYTITFSLAASLLVALTFVPMATSGMLKKRNMIAESKFFDKMKEFYAKTLNFFLNKKWILIITVSVLFITSVGSVFFMNRIFFPPSDMGFVTISVSVKKDKLNDITYEDALSKIVDYLDVTIRKEEYVEDVGIQVTSGLAMLGIAQSNEYVSANVVLTDGKRMTAGDIVEDLVDKLAIIPGLSEDCYEISGSSESMDMGFVSDNTLSFNIYGDELDDTRKAAREIAELFKKVEGVDIDNINDGVGVPPVEYQILIDDEKASPYGIYVAQALQTMQGLLKDPEACTTVKFDSTRLNYDVFVYGSNYKLDRWYLAYDEDFNPVKVYINYDGTYYVENKAAENEADSKVTATRVTDGESITNTFRYTIGETEFTASGGDGNMVVYYSVGRLNDIDLVTFEISSVVMPGTDYEYTVNVPLYKILKDDSFEKDENGNIIYRIKEDENGMPIFLKDEDGFPILDESGNQIPDYVLDDEGNKIPSAIAMKEGYLSIGHDEGVRRLTVSVGFLPDENSDRVLAKCREVINDYDAPAGVRIEVQGENPIITEAYQTLLIVLVLGVVLIYLVMVAQFQSLKSPMIVMFTVPLAFTGSVFAMLLAGKPISVVALVGLVILMGIVVNNGIVFVDYVNQLLVEGMERRKALLKAGRDRIRPILMTALTTIFALIIMAADNSAEGAMMQPMAISTIGGMIYATLLTIFFVPIMFDIFNKKKGVVSENIKSIGPVYEASVDFKPYPEIERYKDEAPYDKSLLKSVSTKSLSYAKLKEIYDNMMKNKND